MMENPRVESSPTRTRERRYQWSDAIMAWDARTDGGARFARLGRTDGRTDGGACFARLGRSFAASMADRLCPVTNRDAIRPLVSTIRNEAI